MKRFAMTLEANGIQFDVSGRYEPWQRATWDEPEDGDLWIESVELDGVDIIEVLDERIICELEQQAWRDLNRG